MSAEERARAIIHAPQLQAFVKEGLNEHNKNNPGSSTRVEKLLLMAVPPSLADGEVTEKGYVNQRVTQERRSTLVSKLFSQSPSEQVANVDHSQILGL